MARNILTNLDLNLNQLLNAVAQILAADPATTPGRIYYHSGRQTFVFHNASGIVNLGRLDQISAPTAPVAFNGQRATGVATPTAADDAATKAYVDAISQGISWKDSVRLASTGNIALATGGLIVVDGVQTAAGDRILVKNQTAGAENGIYAASAGAWVRTTDADTADDLRGAAMLVEEGAAGNNTLWVLSTDPPITLGTTALAFVQIGSGTAGVSKFAADVGDGAALSYAVVHNRNSRDAVVSVRQNATPYAEVYPDVELADANTVTLRFAVAPAAAQYRVTVIG